MKKQSPRSARAPRWVKMVVPLGPDHFGQSGDIPDLYREYGIDTDALLDACAQALLAG